MLNTNSATTINNSGDNNNNNNNIDDEEFDNQNYDERIMSTLNNNDGNETTDTKKKNRTQIIAMISNFSTSYNVVNISLVLPILSHLIVHLTDNNNGSSESSNTVVGNSSSNENVNAHQGNDAAIVASSLLAGMMIGQLGGGALGDAWGYYKALQMMMFLQILGSLGSSFLVQIPTEQQQQQISVSAASDTTPAVLTSVITITSSSIDTMYRQLALWRLVLGIGAGGIYPLAAVLSSSTENTTIDSDSAVETNHDNNATRHEDDIRISENDVEGTIFVVNDNQTTEHDKEDDSVHRVVLTFSMQGLGFVTVPILAVILLHICPNQLDFVWRFLLAFGSVPGIVLFVLFQSNNSQNNNQQSTCRRNSNDVGGGTTENISSFQQKDSQQSNQLRLRRHRHGHESIPIEEIDNIDDDDNDYHHYHRNQTRSTDSRRQITSAIDEFTSVHVCNNTVQVLAQEHVNNECVNDNDDDDNNNNDITIQSRDTLSWWDSMKQEPNLLSKLFGTAFTWFLFDVMFYGNALFQPIVIEAAFGSSSGSISSSNNSSDTQQLQRTALHSLILTSIALPGYIVAAYVMGQPHHQNKHSATIESTPVSTTIPTRHNPFVNDSSHYWTITGQSPRYVMLQGFGVMGILYLIIGMYWDTLRSHNTTLLLVLYGLTFFFANYGPNTSTFVLPSTTFLTNKSTWNGICAACGKLGALCGALLFEPAATLWGDHVVMIICSGIAFVSFLVTKVFVQ